MSQSNTAFRFHDPLNKTTDILLAVPIFSCIGNVIRLYKDLPIQAVYFMKGMMVPHKKSYPDDQYRRSYYSQVRTAKAVMQIFRSGKERTRRLAGGKSRGLDAARAEKMLTESLG